MSGRAKPRTRASSQRKDTFSGSGGRRSRLASGARSAVSAAADGDELQRVLASMPLRVWRTDEVTPLGQHPNDPGAPRDRAAGDRPSGTEFLTVFTVPVPHGTPGRSRGRGHARRGAQRASAR